YVYRIWNSDTPNVFERKYLCRMEQKLDTAQMQRAADLLIGTHDFKAFCGNKKMKKSTVRTLHTARVERLGDEVRLTFEGSGFLQNMVRILAGTLVEVGQGKRNAQEMTEILDSLDRANAGITMPPHGLILDEVYYDATGKEGKTV
ncbi:MAG: tRNA pseudouridine synthase A, partial [Butyricicoccus pullicaecorum]